MQFILRLWWRPWQVTLDEFRAAFETTLDFTRRGALSLALILVSTATAWFLYVPIHELLHAAGCWAAGGTVQELQIAPLYGGRIFEEVFPFVVAGGEYAGRLTRFETGGSDLVYLATDFAPYVLTLLAGIPLLRLARRRGNPLAFAAGAVLTAAPVVGLTGDYYEMGSILVSGAVSSLSEPARAHHLRSDDIFALLQEFPGRFPERRPFWLVLVIASFGVGWMLSAWTLGMSCLLRGQRKG